MYWRLSILALGTFAVGTDGFVIAGILPEISRSLHVTIAATGLLVTMFAFTYAVSSPIVAAIAAHWPRKRLLIAGLLILAAGNVLTATLPAYGLVLASRVVVGLGAGVFTPTASATAASMVPPHQRGRALAVVMAGLSTATALGAPLGTAIGTQTNWQTTLWFVATLAVLGAIGIGVLLPRVPEAPVAGLRTRFVTMKDARIGFTLLTTLLVFTGLFVNYTFVAESFDRATGGNGLTLAVLLVVWGGGATVGSVTAGHLTDRVPTQRIISAALVFVSIDFALLPLSNRHVVSAAMALFVWGVCGWATLVPLQHRLIGISPDHAPVSIGLNSSAIYLGTAASGLAGAAGIALVGVHNLGPFALIFLATGLLSSVMSNKLILGRRRAVERADDPARAAAPSEP